MAGSLFVLPSATPVNGAGRPYPGALLYFYLAGTNTPSTVYANASLTVPHAQPVEADDDGVFPAIWLDPAVNYASRMTTSGGVLVPKGTSDPYPGSPIGLPTQAQLANVLSGITDEETAAGITTVYAIFPTPGDVYRYGAQADGVADDTAAIQAAINQQNQGGPPVILAPGNSLTDTLTIYNRTSIRGAGNGRSTLTYTGSAQLFKQSTPGTRIYNVLMRDFYANDAGTGTIGLDLNSVSEGLFENVTMNGFTTGFSLTGSNGYCVYNRFLHCKGQNATTGFLVGGSGSNSNTLFACRANVCTTGVDIIDSNQNVLEDCQFESGGTGVKITATSAALSDHNAIVNCRFEGNSVLNYYITSTNVRETWLEGNHYVTGSSLDLGTGTQHDDMFGEPYVRVARQTSKAAGAFRFERTASGGSSLPAFRIVDSATSSGTPVTLQIETQRAAGSFVRGMRFGSAVNITAATKASSCVLTSAAHGLTVGTIVYLASVGGMVELNGVYAAITAADTDTFTLGEINSTNYTTYTSGGTATPLVKYYEVIADGTIVTETGLRIKDGITAPSTVSGYATIYVDTSDGDLKVKYGDGTVKTIVVDT